MRCCVETVLASRVIHEGFFFRNETYFLLNFIQLRFFFLQAELYSSRSPSGNLHPGCQWSTAHGGRDMTQTLPVWWQRKHLSMSGYQKLIICYQLMILLLSVSEMQTLLSAVKSFVVPGFNPQLRAKVTHLASKPPRQALYGFILPQFTAVGEGRTPP